MLSLNVAPKIILHCWDSKYVALKRNLFLQCAKHSQQEEGQFWFVTLRILPTAFTTRLVYCIAGSNSWWQTIFKQQFIHTQCSGSLIKERHTVALNLGIMLTGTPLLCHLLPSESRKTDIIPQMHDRVSKSKSFRREELGKFSGLLLWEYGNDAANSHKEGRVEFNEERLPWIPLWNWLAGLLCGSQQILKEMRISDYLTCLLRNLYAAQEATFRTRYRTTDWFKIVKGVR